MGVVEDRSLGLFSGGPAVRCEGAEGAPEHRSRKRWDGKHNPTIHFLRFEYIFEAAGRDASLL